jgi:glycosyltransferase involved in cell wall biosynthesis
LHATNAQDPQEFEQALGHRLPGMAGRIGLAANLLDPASLAPAANAGAPKQAGALRVLFLSRIAHNKNLAFALDSLRGSDRQVHFDIYGPIEEGDYWRRCQRIMAHLPANIRVTYRGPVAPAQVARVLQDYHLFYLPTQGENFGYAIVEAWAAGLPVLISDQTPWRALESKGIGWDLPLAEPAGFSAVLRRVADMEQAEFAAWSRRAQRFAGELLARQNASALPAYRALFEQPLRMAQGLPASVQPAR